MPKSSISTACTPPTWLVTVGSVAIIGHLGAVVIAALTAQSGPWPFMEFPPYRPPPEFASRLNQVVTPKYLHPLKLAHHYRFKLNQPQQPGVTAEVRLKDAEGNELPAVTFPNPEANLWVRHRQAQFVAFLAPDEPVPITGLTESAPAPGQTGRSIDILEGGPNEMLRLRRMEEHLVRDYRIKSRIPDDMPLYRPPAYALLRAKSLARYVCRTMPSVSEAEVIRRTREPIPPQIMFENQPRLNEEDLRVHFGKMMRKHRDVIDSNEYLLGIYQP